MISFSSLNTLLTILTIFIILPISIAFSRGFIANYFIRMSLPSVILPENGSKVLIVAPHNDDESLGAALFIERSVKNLC